MPAWGFALFYAFPIATALGPALGGPWIWLAPAMAGLLTPLADLLLGQDTRNATPEEEDARLAQRRWAWLLVPFVPLQLASLAAACWWAGTHALGAAEWAALVLSVGVVNGGLAINVAHELCHRPGRFEQGLAKALWASVGYLHFHVEHRLGHHARVATPHDPATARLGESVYAFWPRSIAGGFVSAWHLERARLAAHGLSIAHSLALWGLLLPAAAAVGLALAWGPAAGGFFLAQAAAAILVLETVNYLEHYGLERRLVAPGVYERVGLAHSWNASQRLTNWLLLNLQRHSDHHANPGRRYPVLRAFGDEPTLPAGYGLMVLVALVPPLWHRVMDPRAMRYRGAPPTLEACTEAVGAARGGGP